MTEYLTTNNKVSPIKDELAVVPSQIEAAVANNDLARALELIESDIYGAWFGMSPHRTSEIFQLLISQLEDSSESLILQMLKAFFAPKSSRQMDVPALLAQIDFNNPREAAFMALMRMGEFRMNGHVRDAMEQADEVDKHLGVMESVMDTSDGLALQFSVHVGVTAMLAGDFTRALTAFTRAQMHPLQPKFAFLTRDALAKSALIHACFGNTTTAKSLIERADKVPRTSSWVEAHIDTHRDLAEILTTFTDPAAALERIESISLDNIGELWAFYVLAIYRVLDGAGRQDELEHRLAMFDAMPFPRIDGDGFTGSVIPLKRARLAMQAGRATEAADFVNRADQRITYTKLFQASLNLYTGRPQQAFQDGIRLRPETQGFRILEIDRLAILASAEYLTDQIPDSVETLKYVVSNAIDLQPHETRHFSPETRELAHQKVPDWPKGENRPSMRLNGLPQPGLELTEREIETIQYLAQGYSRAKIAEEMFISINTLKSHLKSIYRKLDASTASDAIVKAQKRGVL